MNFYKKFPRCHFNVARGRRIRAKRTFETEAQAVAYMDYRSLQKQGYNAYKCDYCNKWHIGHKN